MKKIGIVYYNVGNMASLVNAFSQIDVEVEIITNHNHIKKFDKIILPGVGHFKTAFDNLKKKKYIYELNNFIKKKNKYLLGICVGMQMMFDFSEEGSVEGLGWIKGNVKKFNKNKKNIKIPHIGWNSVEIKNSNKLLYDIPNKSDFYFVHAYKVQDNLNKDICCQTKNIETFTSIIKKGNLYGVQFHPEKSHSVGLKLLNNFVNL